MLPRRDNFQTPDFRFTALNPHDHVPGAISANFASAIFILLILLAWERKRPGTFPSLFTSLKLPIFQITQMTPDY
jgi:hypothetical protein